MMRPMSGMVLGALLLGLAHMGACTPATREHVGDGDWTLDRTPSELTGDLDAAEARWRREIAASRVEEDRLLTDDPPGAASTDGKVAAEEAESENQPPQTFWGRLKAGANTLGKATFAALTVVATLGMMAAPYLIPAV